jgi:hypothetical protein
MVVKHMKQMVKQIGGEVATPLTCGVADEADEADDPGLLHMGAHTHAHARTRGCNAKHLLPASSASHSMRIAFPNRRTAALYRLNRNHHVRVWCTCMDRPSRTPGYYSERPLGVVMADPRRLGAWDALGYVDVRVPGAALALWQEHVLEVTGR